MKSLFDIRNTQLEKVVGFDVNSSDNGTSTSLSLQGKDNYSIIEHFYADDAATMQLVLATRIGDSTAMEAAINSGASVNTKLHSGDTLLMNSVINKNVTLVKWLLANGANPNSLGASTQRSALQIAVENQSVEIVKLLISAGSFIEGNPSEYHVSPLFTAVMLKNAEIVKQLLNAGADNSYTGDMQLTYLHWAVKRGNMEVITALVTNGADVNAVTNDGLRMTPLHYAMISGSPTIARYLVNKGADFDTVNARMMKPYHIAQALRRNDLIREVGGTCIDSWDNSDNHPQVANCLQESKMHFFQGEISDAVNSLEHAINLDPVNVEGWNALLSLCFKYEIPNSLGFARQALNFLPCDEQVLQLAAQIARKCGVTKLATSCANILTQLFPNSAAGWELQSLLKSDEANRNQDTNCLIEANLFSEFAFYLNPFADGGMKSYLSQQGN